MNRMNKRELLDQIEKDVRLASGADAKPVMGEGDPDAKLMLIGEAPGAQEEQQGRPFVGSAGKNLDRFLEMTGFKRAQLYITNTVKIRPARYSEKTGRWSNRPPTKDEVALFRPMMMREIAAVQPKVVATLGNFALRAVLNDPKVSIGDVHGQPIPAKGEDGAEFILFPLYHPASIIYRRALETVYNEDVARLAEFLRR